MAAPRDPLVALDWVNLYALAVNEENAAGGRVVTAPTNGAAGIIPAVLHYYARFVPAQRTRRRALPADAGACLLYKENASISGAEVGCQGEVGVACSMRPRRWPQSAAEPRAGRECRRDRDGTSPGADVRSGRRTGADSVHRAQCDRAVKAINAARMALRGDGTHYVSLDKVIKTMRETGADMKTKYKETSRGGLAVNVIEC